MNENWVTPDGIRKERCSLTIPAFLSVLLLLLLVVNADAGWRDLAYRNALENADLRVELQAGFIYQLEDKNTTDLLININPVNLSASHCLFGSSSVNLDTATVNQTIGAGYVETVFSWAGGTSWTMTWTLDNGDIVLQMSATSPSPVVTMFFNLTGCNIDDYKLVAIDNYGVAREMDAPYNGALLAANGGTNKCAMSQGFAQSLVTLFEGTNSGWFVEGRDPDVGPSNIMPFGEGTTADLIICRRFPLTTTTPTMYEVRLRAYNTVWQDAVDPHLSWMESVGYVPIDQKPQTWVQDITTQAYVTGTDFAALNALAARVSPYQNKTYIGRQAEYRCCAFDKGYPDYTPSAGAVIWLDACRAQGFHVGVHVNAYGIDRSNTALLTQMQPGLYWNPGLNDWDGTASFAYCSPAYAPWRAHLINAINEVIDPGLDGPGVGSLGADVIYLDQTTSPLGNFVVNGVNGIEGVMLLEQEILSTYAAFDIVIQTEGFNPMASRHASFALAEMAPGHPLSGYIFSRFIKIVPEGYMYVPVELQYLDPFAEWGHFTPGANATYAAESWLEITDVFREFDLVPDSRLPLNANQLSGFSGSGNAKAWFEKTATTRYLNVERPYHNPEQFGVRYTNITQWSGPGYNADWLLYNGSTIFGLDPAATYWFDPAVTLDQNRFHITSVPADYQGYFDSNKGTRSQEVGLNDTNFRIFFSGNGQMSMHVPDEYDVYLDDQKVTVDRDTDSATVTVAATPSDPSIIRAFQRIDLPLDGYFSAVFSSRPQHKIWFVGQSEIFTPNGLYALGSGEGFIIRRFPNAASIRAQGNFKVRDDVTGLPGAAVIRINGTEVMRLNLTGPPFNLTPFDVDLTSYANQYVMMEFQWDRTIGSGTDQADWDNPQIVVTGILTDPQDCNEAIAQGYTLPLDYNQNCYVDLPDLEYIITDWLKCIKPENQNCDHPWIIP